MKIGQPVAFSGLLHKSEPVAQRGLGFGRVACLQQGDDKMRYEDRIMHITPGPTPGIDRGSAKFMGDGVLAYFGFPRAHEEDAERAVRAGLDILAVVAKLETRAKEPLKVRIGIATGIVVVGDLVGQGSAQEQAVVGDTPNLAARLQSLVEPGSLVLAE